MRIASMIRIKLFYFPPSSPRQQLALNKLEQFALRAFFCLHRTCYIYLSLSRRPCGLLAVACPPASWYPQKNANLLIPVNPGSYTKRSATELMPIDRKPEFFKGAQLKVGIIGCGYVGLPLALRFAEAGHKVTGFDTDSN